MLKAIAKIILEDEIDELKEDKARAETEKDYAYLKMAEKQKEAEYEHSLAIKHLNENTKLNAKIKELEEQNAILRQYYDLDKEASQETKDKMYLDLKYKEQEKEIAELKAKQPQVYVMPAPYPFIVPYGAQLPAFMPMAFPQIQNCCRIGG